MNSLQTKNKLTYINLPGFTTVTVVHVIQFSETPPSDMHPLAKKLQETAERYPVGDFLDKMPFVSRVKLRSLFNSALNADEQIKTVARQVKMAQAARSNDRSILLCGHQKSGNTWARFVIFNYFNVKYNDADETLTYSELNDLQRNVIGSANPDVRASHTSSLGGISLPFFTRTHEKYLWVFRFFDTIIHVYRNPLDTLISYYYSQIYRRYKSRAKRQSIDQFVLENIDHWIAHYESVYDKSDIELSYEKRKKSPFSEYRRMIKYIDDGYCPNSLRKAVRLSSFDNIRKMGEDTGEQSGNHPGSDKPHGMKEDYNFARSGEIRQYKKELRPGTIKKCKDIVRESKARNAIV